MAQHASKELFRRYVHVWESGDLDMLGSIVHDDYVGHPSSGDRDRESLRRRILAFRVKYPDVRFRIEDQLVEGNKVASRLIANATSSIDGQKITLYGLNISRIVGDRIIEEWMAWEIQPAKARE